MRTVTRFPKNTERSGFDCNLPTYVVNVRTQCCEGPVDFVQPAERGGDALLFESDETGVGSDSVADAVDGAGKLGVELLGHGLAQLVAKLEGALAELLLGAALAVGDDEEADRA